MDKTHSTTVLQNARGVLTLAIIVVSLVVCFFGGFLPVALAKLVIPNARFRLACTPAMTFFCRCWFFSMKFAEARIAGQKLVVQGDTESAPNGRFLVIGNHQSWADILILLRVTQPQLPFPRFFMKQELIWLPIIGFATWALDMPFMKRYSKEQIAKNPRLRGADLATTRRKCEIFRHIPSLIINYPEGTRLTREKHTAQNSPYRHLLKPRTGGSAFIVDAMGDLLDGVLDITIVYNGVAAPNFWDYCRGAIPEIQVRVRRLPVPREDNIRGWLTQYWTQKDLEIEALSRNGAVCAVAAAPR